MKKNYRPLISVIVPIYNTAEYLKKCLDTLIFQTYQNLEIICINDGSTDNSSEILQNIQKQDNRIIVYNQEHCGVSVARNYGIKNAKGDFISFVDSDDWVLLDLYEKFVQELSLQEDVIDIFMFNAAFYFENKLDTLSTFYIQEDIKNYKEYKLYTSKDINNLLLKNMFVVNKIYRKDLLSDNNINFIEGKNYSEHLFNIQTLITAQNIAVEQEPFYRRRIIDTKNITTEKVFDIFEITDTVKTFLTEQNLIDYYKIEFFIYLCNTFAYYYDICPANLKLEYFNLMRERIKNHLSTFSNNESEYIQKMRNANFVLYSNFTIFNQFKKKFLG